MVGEDGMIGRCQAVQIIACGAPSAPRFGENSAMGYSTGQRGLETDEVVILVFYL